MVAELKLNWSLASEMTLSDREERRGNNSNMTFQCKFWVRTGREKTTAGTFQLPRD